MPMVFAAIGAAIGGVSGAFLIMNATFLASASLLVGSVLLSASAASRAKRKARDAYNASQVDRLANVATTVAPRELVLGRVRKGGHVFFRGSVGQYREKFVMLVALAAHEIDAVETVYLNDVPVALDGSGFVQTAPWLLTRRESASVAGTVAPPEAIPGSAYASYSGYESQDVTTTYEYYVYVPKARIRAYLGSPTQTADAAVAADFPGLWTTAHRAQGVAYLVCEFWYDETAFPSGLPNVTAIIRGARCYDPRSGLTAWTENPALHQRHVLTHPFFGKRTSLGADEEASIVAAANACDVAHNYGQGALPLYRSALVLPFGAPARDALDDLAQAMAGQWAYAAGAFYTRAGVYNAPVMALGEADLAVEQRSASGEVGQQGVGISPHRARADKFNVVTPRIYDQAQDYKMVPLQPIKGAALIARDGAELAQEIDMPGVFYAQQAQHVAGVVMRDARDPLTISLPFKLRAYPLELFDTVSLTLPRYGWAAKTFMVLGRQWTLEGMIQLTLKETTAAIYQPDAAFVASGYAQNTSLPRPWDITPPEGLSVASGTGELVLQSDGTIQSRARVSWLPIADPSLLAEGRVEIQWAPVAVPLRWQSVSEPAMALQTYLVGLPPDGQAILVRARTRNNLATSDWGLQVVHTIVGKTEPPANVSSVTVSGDQVSWPAVSDVDLAGYLLRFQYGQNTWWESAGELHSGIVTASPYTLLRMPVGLCTVMVKAVDTSGNVSDSPAFAYYAFPEPLISNILLTYPQAPTFGGTLTNGTLASGELLADAVDNFYAPGNDPLYLPSDSPMYAASQYAAMVYEFAAMATSPGTLRLQLAITGAYVVEYQTGGQEPMYEPTGDPMFAPVDEPIFGTPGAWHLWPGSLEVDGAIEVRFRITTAGGDTQGVITTATAVLDVPDIAERLAAVAVGAAGLRLPITRTYSTIKTVSLTVHSGGAGASALIVDKDPALGPLVQIINTSGTAVAGVLDAEIQGF